MLKVQTERLFKYHKVMILVLIIMIAASRLVADRVMKSESVSPYKSDAVSERFDELLEQSEGMTLEECAQFIETRQLSSLKGGAEQDEITAVMLYRSELQKCFEVRGYRNYCLYGKGIVSIDIPKDINTNNEKYAGFAVPKVVNSDAFMKYLYMSSFSLIPVIILLLTAVLRADSYEKGVERQIMLSAERAGFHRVREWIMISVIALVCAAEQLSLLIMSGALGRNEYSSAPLQSVTGFTTSAFRGTITQFIVFIIARQLLSAVLCYQVFAILAQKLCSVKRYILAAFGITALMSLASYYIPELSPYMFASIGKTENMAYSLDYISIIDGSEAPLVIILMSSVICGLIIWRREEN